MLLIYIRGMILFWNCDGLSRRLRFMITCSYFSFSDKEYNYVDHSPDLPRQLELVSQYNRRKRRAQQIKDFYSLYKKKHKLYIIFDN